MTSDTCDGLKRLDLAHAACEPASLHSLRSIIRSCEVVTIIQMTIHELTNGATTILHSQPESILSLYRPRFRRDNMGAMTFQEAIAAMNEGKWLRRGEWLFMHRNAAPDRWNAYCRYSPVREDAEFFEVYATMEHGELWPQIMGPTVFSDEDKAATDWGIYEPPTGLDN